MQINNHNKLSFKKLDIEPVVRQQLGLTDENYASLQDKFVRKKGDELDLFYTGK